MLKTFIILFLSTLGINNSHAQNLWGAEADSGQSAGQFDSDFIESGTPSNFAIDAWTALSVYDTGNTVTPGAAFWARNLLGYSEGAYWSTTTPVGSPSQANGVAMFDSDFMDNDGAVGDFGLGSSPSVHKGELISPRIDLTGYTDELIMLKFFSFYRPFQTTELSVSFSVDDGFSWTAPFDYRSIQSELVEGFLYHNFPSNTLAGVINLTQTRIKFTFEGDYYFALVDDVTLMISDLIFTGDFEELVVTP